MSSCHQLHLDGLHYYYTMAHGITQPTKESFYDQPLEDQPTMEFPVNAFILAKRQVAKLFNKARQ